MRGHVLFPVLLLTLVVPALASDEAASRWYRVATASGAVIGFSSQEVTATADGREIVDTQEIDIDVPKDPSPAAPLFSVPRAAHMTIRTVRREDRTGRTISIISETHNGSDWTADDARIDGDTATITHKTAAETRTITVPLPAGVRFDGGEALLGRWNPAVTPALAFDDFNIGAMAVDHVTIEAIGAPDAAGRFDALRERSDGTALLAIARLTLDGGRIVAVRQPLFGSDVEIWLTTQADAQAPHAPYKMLLGTMAKSLYRIPDPATHGHIRYRFGFRDGIVFALPQTGEQRTSAAGDTATVDICPTCGSGLPTDPAYLADARKPTVWLQSNAPEITAIARQATDPSDARKMDDLTKQTQRYLPRVDFNGHYSALDALKRGAGDCTESAALLAALGRAAGIPTRVVNGLVYSRERYHGVSNVFLPHAWVLAFVDGRWRSYDAALGAFDSTHIALSVNDGDERSAAAAQQLAGILRWDAMEEVRARPSP